ncbi:iron chelate uptake ABC transporter family permease subunit [Paenibacillus sp. HJL G12]|uniref:Iron chelate uptake ABC transporter family permease subunit n=1 Tax=Paenibacillus dendrobii TaxID=2691084 RepID=A0A7X3ILW6_9BACL|nr:iron ABC transporter permease [Paenibacillus dendrobii]MWV46344.1 iron chelate uptake ABC transporter family permease subunit [Paenibacillus dendrobii]
MKNTVERIPFIFKLLAAALLFVIIFLLAMVLGAAQTSVQDVWAALTSTSHGEKLSVIREIRLPREIAAIFVGAALAVSGAIMQGMTRNPLADPGLLGLTAGANAALAVTIAFIPSVNYFGLMIACFIGAAVGAGLVFGISAVKRGGFSPLRIVLAGAAISAFLYAVADGVGISFKISKDVSMWTSGGLIGANWEQLKVIVPFIVIGIIIAILLSKQLTILSLSEEVAVGLGQKTARVKAVLFVVTVMLAGASVALVGSLTFIGLMIPHIVRAVVGTDYRFTIPMSAIFGASFMMLADTLARTISAPYEAPVAAIVAVLGLPFFLIIVRKGGRAFS